MMVQTHRLLRYLAAICLVCLTLFTSLRVPAALAGERSPSTVITYTPSDSVIANPERGFFHYLETRATDPTPFPLAELRRYRIDEKVTLVFCITYLDGLTEKPIPAPFLRHIAANFATVRNAGLKCIVSFAYTDVDPTLTGEKPPFGDAAKERILAHLAQLEPILRENADVIAMMQAGFIGVWGEWYYTDYFVDNPAKPWIISPAQFARRREVLERIQAILPASQMVATRYPHGKQAMFGTDVPLDETNAFDGSSFARTAHHNDCFLADATDYGTYREGKIQQDKAYLAAETRYVGMGGETCNLNPPRTDCPTARTELARFHWSYLNTDFQEDVIAAWRAQGCYGEFRRQLGYRLALKQGEYTAAVAPGGAFDVQIDLSNTGYAAPYNLRSVQLVLRNQTTGARYIAQLQDDARRWLPGDHIVVGMLGILPDMPAGSYELLLSFPDPSPALATRPEYAIQLANSGLWEATTGYNRLLHTVRVDPSTHSTPYLGEQYFTLNGEPAAIYRLALPLAIQSEATQ